MDKKLKELCERLTKVFGDRLVSVILYGSGASDEIDQFSDLNIFCVLTKVTPVELAASDPVFRWWQEQRNPPPLLMSEEEVRTSTDCFPIEYRDMQVRRKVLHGVDVIDGLVIDESFYRAQVEFELRSKLLRLRQKATAALSDSEVLVRLMADSVSTFLVLARHFLLLSGETAPAVKREIARALPEASSSFETLLDIREGKLKARDIDAGGLFAQYLKGIQSLVDAVDRLEK